MPKPADRGGRMRAIACPPWTARQWEGNDGTAMLTRCFRRAARRRPLAVVAPMQCAGGRIRREARSAWPTQIVAQMREPRRRDRPRRRFRLVSSGPCARCRATASCRPNLRATPIANRPLPIGLGQTISQPFIVALMTELAEPHPARACSKWAPAPATRRRCSRQCVAKVYSIEIVRAAGREGPRAAAVARLPQRRRAHRRRLQRLARSGAVRRDRRHRRAGPRAAAAGRPARSPAGAW